MNLAKSRDDINVTSHTDVVTKLSPDLLEADKLMPEEFDWGVSTCQTSSNTKDQPIVIGGVALQPFEFGSGVSTNEFLSSTIGQFQLADKSKRNTFSTFRPGLSVEKRRTDFSVLESAESVPPSKYLYSTIGQVRLADRSNRNIFSTFCPELPVEKRRTDFPIPESDSSFPVNELLSSTFSQLVNQWDDESCFMSFGVDKANCPSCKEIIKMGKLVLPMIFLRIENEGSNPRHWHLILKEITGENAVPKEERGSGDLLKITKYWLEWARDRNIA